MEVNTEEAKYHAERANKAAEAAETDAMAAVAAYNNKPD